MRSRETDSRPLASFEGEAAGALAALSLSPARPASAPLESQPLIVVPIPAPIHLATITRGPWDAAKPPLFAMPPDSMHSGAEPPGFLPSDAASLATPALPVTAVEPPRTPPKAPRRASEGSSLVESVAPPGPPLLSGIAARRRIGPLQQHAPLQETRITLPSPSRSFLPSAAPGPRSPWLNVRRAASDIGPLASPALSDRGYVETPNSEVIVASYFPAGSGSLSSVGMAESNGTMNMREHANGHDSKDDSPFPQPLPKLGDSELEAAEALGGLRNAVPSPRPGSTSPVLLPDTTMVTASDTSPKAGDFIARVANYPVVNSGIQQISRMYEAGKESHAIVKVGLTDYFTGCLLMHIMFTYVKLGAQTVESVGTSVIKKLEPALGPSLRSLDRFATNSLDRLEQYVPSFKPTGVAPIRDDEDPMRYQLTGAASTDTVVASASAVELPLPPPSPGLGRDEGGYGGTQPLVQRKPRSTWSTIVSNVGGYVISEETMRGLRYCLQWLQVSCRSLLG